MDGALSDADAAALQSLRSLCHSPIPSDLALVAYYGNEALVKALLRICKPEQLAVDDTVSTTDTVQPCYLRDTPANLASWQGYTVCARLLQEALSSESSGHPIGPNAPLSLPDSVQRLAAEMRGQMQIYDGYASEGRGPFPWINRDRIDIRWESGLLGAGHFASVFKGVWNVHNDGRGLEVAVKILKIPQASSTVEQSFKMTMLAREAVVGLHLRKVIGISITAQPTCAELWLVTYPYDGTLQALLDGKLSGLEPLTVEGRCIIACDVALELMRMHDGWDPPMTHGDVRGANILVYRRGPDWRAHLMDYGLASPHQSEDPGEPGVERYQRIMPPEVLKGGGYSPAADVYSFGDLLLSLFSNVWGEMTEEQEDALREYITLCTEEDEGKRPKVKDIRDFLAKWPPGAFKTDAPSGHAKTTSRPPTGSWVLTHRTPL